MSVQVMTRDDDAAAVCIKNPPDVPGLAYRVFQTVTDCGAEADMILQTGSCARGKDIVFTVPEDTANAVEKALGELLADCSGAEISVLRQCTRLCVTGDGLCGRTGSAAELLRCLWDAGIVLCGVTVSDVKMTLALSREQAERASEIIAEKMLFEE